MFLFVRFAGEIRIYSYRKADIPVDAYSKAGYGVEVKNTALVSCLRRRTNVRERGERKGRRKSYLRLEERDLIFGSA